MQYLVGLLLVITVMTVVFVGMSAWALPPQPKQVSIMLSDRIAEAYGCDAYALKEASLQWEVEYWRRQFAGQYDTVDSKDALDMIQPYFGGRVAIPSPEYPTVALHYVASVDEIEYAQRVLTCRGG